MRDFDTIQTALLAAETGHLVFSTLHTLDAIESVNRIIAVFPPHQGTSQYGMQTFDQSIFGLYQQGYVTLEEALRWASNVDEFKLKVQGISTTAEMATDSMAAASYTGRPEITRFG